MSNEQAIDIAVNLCGGKPRNELSAQIDAHTDTISSQRHLLVPTEEDDDDAKQNDGDGDEEEVYYFDLVQVMSLLIIPELNQIADQYFGKTSAATTTTSDDAQGNTIHKGAPRASLTQPPSSEVEWSDLSVPVSFKGQVDKTGKKRSISVSNKAPGVVKVVIESLIEIFDDDLQRDIRNGMPLDEDMMQTILESFGDVDTAENPQLVQQMLVRRKNALYCIARQRVWGRLA